MASVSNPSISQLDITNISGRIGIDVDQTRIEQIRAEIAGGMDGYATLEAEGASETPQTRRELSGVSFDPDAEENPYNAFISRFEFDGGDGPLSNLDIAVKDNIAVAGVPMTGGSSVFADATPATDAAVVEALLDSGARLVGKTNMDELAYGPTGETSAFGAAENPVMPDRVTGGSSSESAAAVAGNVVDAAFGTDTGGSVRIPASFCGIVGFKPTWGTISCSA